MSKKIERKRVAALESDPEIYHREVPVEALEIEQLIEIPFHTEIQLVGRIMLADTTGIISKLGVYATRNGRDVIILENIESNGISVPAYAEKNEQTINAMNSHVHVGDVLLFEGYTEFDSEYERVVFIATELKILSKATGNVYDRNIDFRKRSNIYNHRHLQMLRDPELIVQFRKYSRVYKWIRKFLYACGYDEVSMTLLQESFEAGFATPFETYVVDKEKNMYLRLTAELFLRKLMIAGFSKVFEISKSFRNQCAVSTMHPEFTILELYHAYSKEGEMECLVREILQGLLIEIYGKEVIPSDNGNINCSGEWKSVNFKDEVERLTGKTYDENRDVSVNARLLDILGVARPQVLNKYTVGTELYVHLMSKYREPTFLQGLPASTSPLNKLNDDGSTIDETLLVINGMLVADIVNVERDSKVLRARMEEQITYRKDCEVVVNEDLLHAMQYGLPPCRGIGIGIERLLMLIFNKKELRDVEVFPIF